MTGPARVGKEAGITAGGWIEAGLFAVTLSVLNISYALGHQIGAHATAFLIYAMLTGALSLLAVTGPGPHWRAIVRHPLSFAVGGGIIAMEATYYLLLQYVSPTDGSLLVRLGVPMGALIGFMLFRRKPTLLSLIGNVIVVAAIAFYIPGIASDERLAGVLLATASAAIMSSRAFATEFHPWNRSARTVFEKMRVTGLVLLVTSIMGTMIVLGLMGVVASGAMPQTPWLPRPDQLLHGPTVALGLFIGCLVLTAMQYFAFSAVVKIRTENYLAITALVPAVTLVFQILAVASGLLTPIPLDWRTLPSMVIMMAGVFLVIWGGRRLAD